MAELAGVKLMSDYDAESPLWIDNVMIDPRRLALSVELSTGLLAWQAHFVAHFHHEGGWDTTSDRSWYGERGDELVRSLREELPAGTTLEIDLWPLDA